MEEKEISQSRENAVDELAGEPDKPAFVIPEGALAIIPMRNAVLFPGMILPFTIGREASLLAAQHAVKADCPVGILLQRNPEVEFPGPDDLYTVGTVASIMRYVTMPDNAHVIVRQGLQRFRVTGYLSGFPFQVASVERIEAAEITDSQIEARFVQLKERAMEVMEMLPQASPELVNAIGSITSPGALADLVAGMIDIKPAERQSVLEA
ncbi:MAG: hypothetical protein ACD_10C00557G0001, partial [uncultured bacterium]